MNKDRIFSKPIVTIHDQKLFDELLETNFKRGQEEFKRTKKPILERELKLLNIEQVWIEEVIKQVFEK